MERNNWIDSTTDDDSADLFMPAEKQVVNKSKMKKDVKKLFDEWKSSDDDLCAADCSYQSQEIPLMGWSKSEFSSEPNYLDDDFIAGIPISDREDVVEDSSCGEDFLNETKNEETMAWLENQCANSAQLTLKAKENARVELLHRLCQFLRRNNSSFFSPNSKDQSVLSKFLDVESKLKNKIE